MRKAIYVSGTRADFGLMLVTLKAIASRPEMSLSVAATGMHLSSQYGNTVTEIEASGLQICGRIPVDIDQTTGHTMARAAGQVVVQLADLFHRERPDIVVLLGDRGEMLAGAIAALYQNIPVAHICGGELSGTVDEPVRHAISKLSHYHFVATDGARKRLERMGERPEHIFVTGTPGLDGLRQLPDQTRAELLAHAGFSADRPVALVVFHPVVQQQDDAGIQASAVMQAAVNSGLQVICLMPNSDAGGSNIREAYSAFEGHRDVRLFAHLARPRFVAWMAAADVMVGNSSSGILEAASFHLPVVNVGSRQQGRERSDNVIDVGVGEAEIRSSIISALSMGKRPVRNVYGDGRASERISEHLSGLPLTGEVLFKLNCY